MVSSLSAPTYVTHANDQRLFIVERAGRIRIYDRSTSTLRATPLLDVASKVSTDGERGMLSLAFHTDYATNRYFYVYYTDLSGRLVIERYQTTSGDPNVADPSSAATLLVIQHPGQSNHNGGQLQIGRDGHLYAGTGDGGGGGDTNCNAQFCSARFRLDVHQLEYAPFYGFPPTTLCGANDPGPGDLQCATRGASPSTDRTASCS